MTNCSLNRQRRVCEDWFGGGGGGEEGLNKL